NDNDFQDPKLSSHRWKPANNWKADSDGQPRTFTHDAARSGEDWLRYRHILRGNTGPSLITDFMGYNSGSPGYPRQQNWVGDLMLECDVKVLDPQGAFVLELSKGTDRFQACWDLKSSTCTLTRLTDVDGKPTRKDLDEPRASTLKTGSTYRLRLANFDQR